jgi:hypothetical protein
MSWTRREFFKGSAAAMAGAYGLFPALGLAEHVPDKFVRPSCLGSIGKSTPTSV